MPRFHFNVYDGKSYPDEEGTELPDWVAARIEAISVAGHILKDEAKSIALGDDWRIEVTDDTGLIIFQLTIQATTSPVLEQSARSATDAH